MTITFLLVMVSCGRSIPQEAFPTDIPYKPSAEINAFLQANDEPWKNQDAAWKLSFIGEYSRALEVWDDQARPYSSFSREDSLWMRELKPVDAISYLANAAAGHTVVVINEAHHQPMHRVFTAALLQPLYDQGFRFLGLEALNWSDSLINKRGFPILSSGYYISEPQYGNMVREAIRIGYTVFPYEAEGGENGKEREISQARNIANVMNQHPEAKILIHCGFAHVVEGDYPSWGKAMAGRLKEFTGINPLTINQDKFTERSHAELDHPVYGFFDPEKPVILIDTAGTAYAGPEGLHDYDVRVLHPHSRMENGRPHWLVYGKRQWWPVPVNEINLPAPYLVFAYPEAEPVTSVPVDVMEVHADRETAFLSLLPGRYKLRILGSTGEEHMLKIKVP
jgi:hypothetical protein